jgi:hypothetical protein
MNKFRKILKAIFSFLILGTRKRKVAMGPEDDYERWLGI